MTTFCKGRYNKSLLWYMVEIYLVVSFLGWPEFFYIFNIQLTLRFKRKNIFSFNYTVKVCCCNLQAVLEQRKPDVYTILNCFKIVQIQYTCIFQKTTICDFWKPIKFQSKFYIEWYTCASATNGPIPLQTIHQW